MKNFDQIILSADKSTVEIGFGLVSLFQALFQVPLTYGSFVLQLNGM